MIIFCSSWHILFPFWKTMFHPHDHESLPYLSKGMSQSSTHNKSLSLSLCFSLRPGLPGPYWICWLTGCDGWWCQGCIGASWPAASDVAHVMLVLKVALTLKDGQQWGHPTETSGHALSRGEIHGYLVNLHEDTMFSKVENIHKAFICISYP